MNPELKADIERIREYLNHAKAKGEDSIPVVNYPNQTVLMNYFKRCGFRVVKSEYSDNAFIISWKL